MKFEFSNGLKLIYEYRQGNITSFTIGFNAGAIEEQGFPYGTAHALEHMLFKGTNSMSEIQINLKCDRLFGFNNAMTNYPYAIYYGTLMTEEFREGFNLFSDIILNPLLGSNGFDEEISVILEELKEWKDDPYQFCEDELFYNAFEGRRIKYPIIGTEKSIKEICPEVLKKFYNRYYCPENCVISVVSSEDFDGVKEIVGDCFEKWNKTFYGLNEVIYENNSKGVYETIKDISGAKVYYCYPMHDLTKTEIEEMRLFNNILGCGTSSMLYDAVRTKNGFAYDISSIIKNERGIKLLEVYFGTSNSSAEKAIEIVEQCVNRIKTDDSLINKNILQYAAKSIKLKRMLSLEKSIELSKAYTTYELMYGSAESIYTELDELKKIDVSHMLSTVKRVLKNPSIQIIRS